VTSEASDFVGRTKELRAIRQAIEAPDHSTYVILISGPSGVGKTRLLQEIPRLYRNRPDVFVAQRIDCYETSAHVPFGVERRLAGELGSFGNFARSFCDWYRLKLFEVQSPPPAARRPVQEAFLYDYNERAWRQRIVLRFDTMEVARRSKLWERIVELSFHLKNTVLLLAGQDVASAQAELEEYYRAQAAVREKLTGENLSAQPALEDQGGKQRHNIQVKRLLLSGFEKREIRKFFEHHAGDLIAPSLREKIRFVTGRKPMPAALDIAWLRGSAPIRGLEALTLEELKALPPDELAQHRQRLEQALEDRFSEKIRILTDGIPALVTLAIAWLRRSVPTKKLGALSLKEIEALSSDELSQLQQEVEQALVEGVLQLTDYVDQAILQMAWVYRRFDVRILSTLLGIPTAECEAILAHLQDLPFTRVLPNGVCVLHDRIRELVVKYDWPIVDPNGTYRLELDRKMVRYYDQVIAEQKDEAERLRQRLVSSPAIEQPGEGEWGQTFDRWVTADTAQWVYEAEGLFYALRADPEQGVSRFVRAFDETTDSNRDLRELLVSDIKDQTEKWRAGLSMDADYAIGIRLAKNLADAGQTGTAYQSLLSLLNHQSAIEEHRADLLIQLGNAAVRLGKIAEGKRYFDEAFELSTALNNPLWAVRSGHALAWLQRLQGRWSEAVAYYRAALEKAPLIGDEKQRIRSQAWLENGLGYVEHLQGHSEEAERRCLRALDLWQRLNVPMQLGSLFSTLGEVMTGQDRYDEALKYYWRAIYIFEEQRAWEWQVIVYHQMAYSRWCATDYDNAWRYILRSQRIAMEYKVTREWPVIFHRLGLLAWHDLLDLDQAIQRFERGAEASRHHQNGQMLLENLVALVELAYRSDDDPTMERCAGEMFAEIQKWQLNYPLIEGRLERILAQAAHDHHDYDRALAHYLKAIPLIAQHGGYARYRLSNELDLLRSRLEELAPPIALSWCEVMHETWRRLEVSQVHPELLDFCEQQRARLEKG